MTHAGDRNRSQRLADRLRAAAAPKYGNERRCGQPEVVALCGHRVQRIPIALVRASLCLERQLADDAQIRGWDREVDRHQRIADRIRSLLSELGEPSGRPEDTH